MASLKAVTGSERALQKLNKLLESEDFYEAHQLYRTINFRYSNAGRFEELARLFLDGAVLFLNKKQHNSGADLALLYVEAVKNDPNVTESKCRRQGVRLVCERQEINPFIVLLQNSAMNPFEHSLPKTSHACTHKFRQKLRNALIWFCRL